VTERFRPGSNKAHKKWNIYYTLYHAAL